MLPACRRKAPFAQCAKNALGPAMGEAKTIPEKPQNFTRIPAGVHPYVRANTLETPFSPPAGLDAPDRRFNGFLPLGAATIRISRAWRRD